MAEPIDWEALAIRLGLFHSSGESGSSEAARAALEEIIGEARLIAAVDHYVSGARGSELARSVLWLLHSLASMQRCMQIFAESTDLDIRVSAVELLRVVADRRALEWIPRILADPDLGIQSGGIGIADQLLFSGLVLFEEIEPVLQAAAQHENPIVRETALGLIVRYS